MNTIGDLIKTLEHCKNLYPEFEKYNLCMDVAPDNADMPDLRGIRFYINTDIGQVEITPDRDDEWEIVEEEDLDLKFKAGDRVFNKMTRKWVNIIEFDIETGLYIVRYDDGIQGEV